MCVSIEQLGREQFEWSFYPSNLSQEEQLNPYLIIDRFFEDYNLPEYREHLRDWLHHGLSTKASREFIEPQNLVRVNDNLQALYTAAWFIFQRLAIKPSLKSRGVNTCSQRTTINDSPEQSIVTDSRSLYTLDSNLSVKQSTVISKLVSVIIHKVSSVQAIIYLGESPSGKFYLLVLTANDETRLAQGLAGMIEESCDGVAEVVALVHHASAVNTGLKRGNRFFNIALSRPAVYLSGGLILPVPEHLVNTPSIEISGKWDHWLGLSYDFYNGAKFHFQQGGFNGAMFCLHQSAECVLVALVRAVLEYDINNHNLSRLLSITQMFSEDVVLAFNLESEQGKLLFDELKHAYVNVRYKDGYEAERNAVERLIEIVKQLMGIAEGLYQKHMLTSNL